MSRLAIKNLLGPAKLHLDIGCTHLVLQHGKSLTRHKLSTPLKLGIPDRDTLAELRVALVNICATVATGTSRLEISVSDAIARSWIVERLPGLASVQEIEALAAAQMQQRYGDSDGEAAEWIIRLDAMPFAQRWPAIALPKALLALLLEFATLQGWVLGKIQTRFVRCLNAEPKPLFSRSKVVVYSLDTPDGLAIGIRQKQAWLALRTHPPLALLSTSLPAMLRRESRAAGLNLDDCRVQALQWPANEEVACV